MSIGCVPSRRGVAWRLFLLLSLMMLPAALSPLPAAAWEDDRPAGGDEASRWEVARLRVTDGPVYVLSEGEQDWEEVEGNFPLGEGDRVSVPGDGNAVVSFRGQEAHLSGGADFSVVYLREERTAYKLSDGKARFLLSDYDFIPARVTLPSGARVRFEEPGAYRISVGDDEESVVRVVSGAAVVSDPEGGKVRLRRGQQAFVGDGVRISRYDEPAPREEAPPYMSDEERRVEAPPSVVYELRDYGDWVLVGDYGYVWRPRVSVGWSPFTFGQWYFSVGFGWNWVSYEPWGWFPYHCGRWYQDRRFGWVWVPRGAFRSAPYAYRPGITHYRPVAYYPATVRIVRDRDGVRWVPLAPRERFVRPVIRREDTNVYRYVRPLSPGTVFTRDWGRGGGRTVDSWRGVEPRTARPPATRPRDDRPVRRPGDESVPFRGDRAVSPDRIGAVSDAEGRTVGPGGGRMERPGRERREPRVLPPPSRRGLTPGGGRPERRAAEPSAAVPGAAVAPPARGHGRPSPPPGGAPGVVATPGATAPAPPARVPEAASPGRPHGGERRAATPDRGGDRDDRPGRGGRDDRPGRGGRE